MPPTTETPPSDGSRARSYRVLFSFGTKADGHYGTYPTAPLLYMNGTFYGTTSAGGFSRKDRDPIGVVFSMNSAGKLRVLRRFELCRCKGPYGNEPYAGLTSVRGSLYGTTYEGGSYGYGTIFRMATSGELQTIYSFDFTDPTTGSGGPVGTLVDVNGTLYGVTVSAGSSDYGSVYSVSTRGAFRTLHYFNGADGANPAAGLLNVGGTLYGTTNTGGAYNKGTVFSMSTGGAETVLFSFDGSNGAYPADSLIAVNGKLYGTTVRGGSADWGTVFSMTMKGKSETVLHSFSHANGDGARPDAGLIAVNGTLFGTTAAGGISSPSAECRASGCGIIYSVTTAGKYAIVHQFQQNYANDGSVPTANLIVENGKLYGTTEYGGYSSPKCSAYSCYYGTVFQFRT